MSNNRASHRHLGLALAAVMGVLFFTQCTLFVVPPIGAIPEGRTLILLRWGFDADGDMVRVRTRFIDSADAICRRELGGVNLLCRGSMMAAVVGSSTIILRLPYSETLRGIAE